MLCKRDNRAFVTSQSLIIQVGVKLTPELSNQYWILRPLHLRVYLTAHYSLVKVPYPGTIVFHITNVRGCIQNIQTDHLERELQMIQLPAIRCSCIAIL
jgi:hypothetical protein